MSEESKNDLVKEARELLARLPNKPYNLIEHDTIFNFYLAAPELLSALCDEVEELRRRNATQEESITHMQSQLRVMKEAIEFLVSAAEFSLSTPGMIRGRDQLKNAKEQGHSAITPKGAV